MDAYAAALPRLQAEEALRWADIISVPHLTRDARRELIARWRRVAAGQSAVQVLHSAADIRRWFAQAGYQI